MVLKEKLKTELTVIYSRRDFRKSKSSMSLLQFLIGMMREKPGSLLQFLIENNDEGKAWITTSGEDAYTD